MSWGTELWDQFDAVGTHTQKGIDFCEKYSHFIKERCAIENEYAAKLKKLVKSYKPKKAEDEEFTCIRGFYRMLNELHDLAGQHESISECLSASIFKELLTLINELKSDRRKYLHDGAKQQNILKTQLEQLDKSKKQYEKAFKESEKAQENYKKADADIHLSRADVEKAKNLMHTKQQNSEQCKSEYALELQKSNTFQSEHYNTRMPSIFTQLQTLEEKRVNTIQDFIKQCADIERRTIPIVNTCIDGMVNAAQSVDAQRDTKIVIEKYKSGFQPPEDIPFEDLSNQNATANHNQGGTPKTLRGDKNTVSGRNKKQRGGLLDIFGRTKAEDTREDFSNYPPQQQKRKLTERIDAYKQDITKETAARDGMLKMRDVYSQNPNLGDSAVLDKQLEQNAQKLDALRKEQQKYEGFLAEVDKNVAQSTRSLDSSQAKRMSDVSLSSTASGTRASNPGTPQQSHNPVPIPKSTPELQHQRVSTVSGVSAGDDSFDDLDDPDEYDFSIAGTCTALYAFEAPNEGSIMMREGEEFSVLEKDQGDGWTRVKRSTGEIGFVPTSYIQTSFP